ncbi:FtsB family cell division protein [Tuberibacillus calidus]|uniref:FtsB family cell division protein n=1 Tax=Tuberibacillus calidus TaxID=340097 RepID=UPI0004152182|nr:septum formation initiator family protein [Tuberibacillus calidus]
MKTGSRSVTPIRSEYVASREIYEKVQRKRRKGLIRRLAAFFILFGFAVSFMIHALLSQSAKLHEMEAQKAHLQKQLSNVKQEQRQLQRDIKLLNDEDYLGKLARKNFFMSKNGEIIFTTPQTEER